VRTVLRCYKLREIERSQIIWSRPVDDRPSRVQAVSLVRKVVLTRTSEANPIVSKTRCWQARLVVLAARDLASRDRNHQGTCKATRL
jgi:hypothetical protein